MVSWREGRTPHLPPPPNLLDPALTRVVKKGKLWAKRYCCHLGIVEWLSQKTDPNYKPSPESVITLTQDNFADLALNQDLILLEFYAPW